MSRSGSLNTLISRVARRAERTEPEILAKTFVEIEQVTSGLRVIDHQILYGRRGTGKTHAFNYLAVELAEQGDLPIYVDLRVIGSSGGIYSDSAQPVAVRGTRLLVDVIESLYDSLLDHAVEEDAFAGLLEHLDGIAAAATEVHVEGPVSESTEVETDRSSERSSGWNVSVRTPSAMGAEVSSSGRTSTRARARQSVQRTGEEFPRIMFGRLHRALRSAAQSIAPHRIWLLLDEWSSLPPELQPILADLLRRTFFPCRQMTVKIGAIERRSRFCERLDNAHYIGIELGSDTAATVNLDEHLLATEASSAAMSFFAELLFKHLRVLLEQMGRQLVLETKEQLLSDMFEDRAFAEFVRASEGVPRDALNIIADAASRAGHRKIHIADIHWAARQYYLRDKESGIRGNKRAQEIWAQLQRSVVVQRRSRTFLLKRTAEDTHPAILDLFDARLIHLLRPGIHTSGQSGITYDGYSVDFGSYVDILKDSELGAAWQSVGTPWLFNGGKAFLPDRFDDSVIFMPGRPKPGRAAVALGRPR